MTAQTTAERQRAYKARQLALGLSEVRGIFAHVNDHEAIKAEAAKIARRRARKQLSSNA